MDFQGNYKEFLNNPGQPESEDLTEKEMRELQEAIKKSKESAEIEEEKRQHNRQAEEIKKRFYKPSTSSEDFFTEAPTATSPSSEQERKQPESPDVASTEKEPPSQRDAITFLEFSDAPESNLDIVHHPPRFNLPITTNPQYQKLSFKARAKFLIEYYKKIEALRAKIARRSLRRAPLPRPIQPSDYCTSSLSRITSEESTRSINKLFEHIPDQQVYVSRAGRQIKRKIYTEEQEGDSDSDFKYSVKKNRGDDPDLKLTFDGPLTSHQQQEEVKSPTKVARARRDSPRRLPLKKFSSRSEEMFDKMREDEEKKRLQEQELNTFQKTLTEIDEDEGELIEASPTKGNQEENFIRRRVVPPIPMKKGGRAKKATTDDDADNKNPETPPGSPVLKRYPNISKTTQSKLRAKLRTPKSKDSIYSEEPSTSKLVKTTPCPICNKEFPQSEILHHASSCGIEEDTLETVSGINKGPVKTIKCELCDQEFPIHTEYEAHVKQCIASSVTDL